MSFCAHVNTGCTAFISYDLGPKKREFLWLGFRIADVRGFACARQYLAPRSRRSSQASTLQILLLFFPLSFFRRSFASEIVSLFLLGDWSAPSPSVLLGVPRFIEYASEVLPRLCSFLFDTDISLLAPSFRERDDLFRDIESEASPETSFLASLSFFLI